MPRELSWASPGLAPENATARGIQREGHAPGGKSVYWQANRASPSRDMPVESFYDWARDMARIRFVHPFGEGLGTAPLVPDIRNVGREPRRCPHSLPLEDGLKSRFVTPDYRRRTLSSRRIERLARQLERRLQAVAPGTDDDRHVLLSCTTP